jgi:hypothetical protein
MLGSNGEDNYVPAGTKEITKQAPGKTEIPATIADIFKYKQEAILIAKMMGNETDFNMIFSRLYKDVTSLRGDGRYGQNDIRSGWHCTIDNFLKLTPHYKGSLKNVTLESMKLLILETRKEIIDAKKTNPKRYNKRSYCTRNKEEYQNRVRVYDLDRLTPLSDGIYKHYFAIVALRRFGCIARNTVSINTTAYYHVKNKKYDGSSAMQPIIFRGKIIFTLNNQIINRDNWAKVYKGDRGTNVCSPNKLKKIRRLENYLADELTIKKYVDLSHDEMTTILNNSKYDNDYGDGDFD